MSQCRQTGMSSTSRFWTLLQCAMLLQAFMHEHGVLQQLEDIKSLPLAM